MSPLPSFVVGLLLFFKNKFPKKITAASEMNVATQLTSSVLSKSMSICPV